jgi:hypothetical protein
MSTMDSWRLLRISHSGLPGFLFAPVIIIIDDLNNTKNFNDFALLVYIAIPLLSRPRRLQGRMPPRIQGNNNSMMLQNN